MFIHMDLQYGYCYEILHGLLLYCISYLCVLDYGLYWLCAYYFNAVIQLSGYVSRQCFLVNFLTSYYDEQISFPSGRGERYAPHCERGKFHHNHAKSNWCIVSNYWLFSHTVLSVSDEIKLHTLRNIGTGRHCASVILCVPNCSIQLCRIADCVGPWRQRCRLSADSNPTHVQRYRKRKWRHDDDSGDAWSGAERSREVDSTGCNWNQRRSNPTVASGLSQR